MGSGESLVLPESDKLIDILLSSIDNILVGVDLNDWVLLVVVVDRVVRDCGGFISLVIKFNFFGLFFDRVLFERDGSKTAGYDTAMRVGTLLAVISIGVQENAVIEGEILVILVACGDIFVAVLLQPEFIVWALKCTGLLPGGTYVVNGLDSEE